jgi:transposase-like protein
MKGSLCTICDRADRKAIDRSCLTPGTSLRSVSRRIGVTQSALHRHFTNHVRNRIQDAAARAIEGDDLLAELKRFYMLTKNIVARTYQEADYRTAIRAIRVGVDQLRLNAELTGALKPQAASGGYVLVFDGGVPKTVEAIEATATALPAALPATNDDAVEGTAEEEGTR